MSKCGYCGSPLRPGAKFCSKCGKSVEEEGSISQTRNSVQESSAIVEEKKKSSGSALSAVLKVIIGIIVLFFAASALFGKSEDKGVKQEAASAPVKQEQSTSTDSAKTFNEPISNIASKSSHVCVGILTGDEVNIREGAGVNYKSKGFLYKGDKVRLIGESTNDKGETWYQVEYDKPSGSYISGWIRNDFVSKSVETTIANSAIIIKRVKGTSHFSMKDSNRSYPASQIADGVIKTCWIEGVSGYGVNERVDFEFDDVYEVKGFNIWTGYQKSEELFYKNCRPIAVMVRSEDGYSNLHKISDSMGMQRITFLRPIKARYISVAIVEVMPGKSEQNTCISEISFFN